MKVLLVGSGAREHALAWKLGQSRLVDQVFAWPGGVAMADAVERFDLDAAPAERWPALVRKAKAMGIDFMVVGPEGPLAEGLADRAAEAGLPVFGPSARAAALESSKAFAKDVMQAAKIPTAAFETARSRSECEAIARRMLQTKGATVLKASGLAQGKGVFVCHDEAQLSEGLSRLYDGAMQAAAETVVIEECLVGRECSFFTFIGHGGATPLGFAVDFKRLRDGDQGPNTGGMGCYTPVPWLPADAARQVNQAVVEPLLAELKRRGINYAGCLYVGLMWTDVGPRVVEFNVRLGDPEAQVLARHDGRDWGRLIAAKLGLCELEETFGESQDLSHGASVAVVMASKGYPYGENEGPSHPLSRKVFTSADADVAVFGAAIKAGESAHVATGTGRVLTVTAKAADFAAARRLAYQRVSEIAEGWQGVQYRRDIAAELAGKKA